MTTKPSPSVFWNAMVLSGFINVKGYIGALYMYIFPVSSSSVICLPLNKPRIVILILNCWWTTNWIIGGFGLPQSCVRILGWIRSNSHPHLPYKHLNVCCIIAMHLTASVKLWETFRFISLKHLLTTFSIKTIHLLIGKIPANSTTSRSRGNAAYVKWKWRVHDTIKIPSRSFVWCALVDMNPSIIRWFGVPCYWESRTSATHKPHS